jgi:hypothetical protein
MAHSWILKFLLMIQSVRGQVPALDTRLLKSSNRPYQRCSEQFLGVNHFMGFLFNYSNFHHFLKILKLIHIHAFYFI